MSTPPSNGPTVSPKFIVTWDRVLAAGSSSGPTSRGMIALRAGLLTAKKPDCSAITPYSSATDSTFIAAWM